MIHGRIEEVLEKFVLNEIEDSKDQNIFRSKIPEVKTYFIMLYINSGNNALYNVLGGYITNEEGFLVLLKQAYAKYQEGTLAEETGASDIITKSIINDSFLKKFVNESKAAVKPIIAIFFSGFFDVKETNWITETRRILIDVDVNKYKELMDTSETKSLLNEGIMLCEELISIREKNNGDMDNSLISTYLLMAKRHSSNKNTNSELDNYNKIIKIVEAENLDKKDYMIDVYRRVGEINEERKHLNQAKLSYNKWIEYLKHFNGESHMIVARASKKKSLLLEKKGEIAKAINILLAVEHIYYKNLRLSDDEIIEFYEYLINLNLLVENFEELKELTLKLNQRVIEQNLTRHIKGIELKIIYGELCKHFGDFEEMEDAFFECNKIIKDVFGDKHHLHGRILLCRGDIELDNNNFEEAEKIYRNAYDIISESLGKNHISAIEVSLKFAQMHEKMGEYEYAMFHYNKYIKEREQQTTADDVDLLNIKEKLCNVMILNNGDEQAMETLTSILKIKEDRYYRNHFQLISIYKYLGLAKQYFDKNNESKEFYEKSLKLSSKIYKTENQKILFLEEKLGEVCDKLDDYYGSINYYNTVLEKVNKGDDNLEKARIHKILCRVLIARETSNENVDDGSMNQLAIQEAYEHIDMATKITESEVGKKDLLMLECLNLASEIDFLQKNSDDALKKLREIVKILKANFGQYNHNLAVANQNIAKILINNGQLDEVLPLLQDALKINLKKYGPSNSVVAENYGNIAMFYYHKKDKENTLINFEKALEINNSLDKPVNYMTPEMYYALSEIYMNSNKIEKAIEYLVKTIKMNEYLKGDSEEVNRVKLILDEMYTFERNEEYDNAKQNFSDYIMEKITNFGKESVGDSNLYKQLCGLLIKSENIDLAELYINKKLIIDRSNKGEFVLPIVDDFLEIAKVQIKKGEFVGATESIENIDYIVKKNDGADRLKLGKIKCQIGILKREMGEINIAIDNLKSAVEYFQAADSVNTPFCWNALKEMGLCYIQIGEYKEALELFKKCQTICESDADIDKKYALITYRKIGSIYDYMEEYETAKEYYKKSLALSKEINGDDSVITGAINTELGVIFKNNEEFSVAKKYFADAKNCYKNSIGDKHNNYKYLLALISENELNFQEQKERIKTFHKKIFDFVKGN